MSCKYISGETVAMINENGANSVPTPNPVIPLTHKDRTEKRAIDFADVDREVRDFMVAHGINGRCPTYQELSFGNSLHLARIIRLNGGFARFATRIGLRYVPPRQLTTAQWIEFQQVLSEIQKFIEDNHLNGRMPLNRELRGAGLHQLTNSVLKFGGFGYIAAWMGFQ